jgi:pimeloyl-ACP methyl ester carboxylesterase
MFLFRKAYLFLAILFGLIIISSVIINQNMGAAQSNRDAAYQYQTPLFASLDNREEGDNNEPLHTGKATIRQNATLTQIPSSSSSAIQKAFGELGVSTYNSSKESTRSHDLHFYNSSLDSGFFLLDGVPFSHRRSEVNDLSMHYVIGGEGDPVVLLHGWPQTWYEWRHVMPILAKNNYTVIVPDLRGLGDTSKPSAGYDGNTTANDIYQLISNLGFNKSSLIGHDIGAQTAYSYAVVHPNNVSKLVVMNFVFPGSLSKERVSEPWWFAFHRTPDLPEALVAGHEREYLSWFYRQLAYNPYSINEEDIDEYVRHYSAPGGMRSGFEYFRAFSSDAKENNETSKSELNLPVLALSGELSNVERKGAIDNPTMESARTLARNVTGVTMPLSGQWIPEEQPRLLTDLMLVFFNNNTQRQLLYENGSLSLSAIEDLVSTVENNTLHPTSDQLQPGSLTNRSSAEKISSNASANLSSVQEQQAPSGITNTGKQNISQPTNQSTVTENVGDQGTPLSEAIEAITRMFRGGSGGG